jgi:hypothetical protein
MSWRIERARPPNDRAVTTGNREGSVSREVAEGFLDSETAYLNTTFLTPEALV